MKKVSINVLSDFRTQIMGVASVFIMLCHNSFVFVYPVDMINGIFVSSLLQFAVDIFMLLSGLGLYYSFCKNSIAEFYKKRMARIIPNYILFVIIAGLISVLLCNVSLKSFVYKFSLVSYYISGDITVWFVAGILLLYLIFPLLFNLSKYNSKLYALCFVAVIVIAVLPIWDLLPYNFQIIKSTLITRVPIFMIGIFIGKKLYEKNSLKVNVLKCIVVNLFFVVLFVINVVFNKYNTWTFSRLLFLPISLSFALILGYVFELVKIKTRRINAVFLFLGSITLEIYLIHERILQLTDYWFNLLSFDKTIISLASNATAMLLSVVLAFCLHSFIFKAMKLLRNHTIKKK